MNKCEFTDMYNLAVKIWGISAEGFNGELGFSYFPIDMEFDGLRIVADTEEEFLEALVKSFIKENNITFIKS